MKQDKGREGVTLNLRNYIEECLKMLHSGQFEKLDPTKTIETKVQQTLWQTKHVFTKGEYKPYYSTGSNPDVFYGTVKVHKLK